MMLVNCARWRDLSTCERGLEFRDVGDEGLKFITRLFLLAALLIVITMASYVMARIAYRWITVRMAGSPE